MEDRTTYLGGTDASAILGLNRWVSPLMVWQRKTSQTTSEVEPNIAMEVGIELEALVAKMFVARTGKKVVRHNATLHHKDHPFLAANIDRRIVGERAILECKTASVFKEKEWKEDDIPQEYLIQCLHYLYVTGYDIAYLAVLIGNHNFVIKKILVEDYTDFIMDMVEKEIYFWKNHVEKGVMPTTFTPLDSTSLFELFPTSDAETSIVIDDKLNSKFDRLVELRKMEKSIKAETESIKNEMKASLGTAKTGVTDRWKATWTLQSRSSLNTKLFKTELPNIYDKYTRKNEFKVFRYTPIKTKEAAK